MVIMSTGTSLFRATKTRSAKSQQQLKSSLLQYKNRAEEEADAETQYSQTYNVPLPQASVSILQPIVSALATGYSDINPGTRALFTIGVWREECEAIYRCCFVQPELSSTTCSFGLAHLSEARAALTRISEMFPDAPTCTINTRPFNGGRTISRPQLSGRMTPYVVDDVSFDVKWCFANVSKSFLIFIRTDENGQKLLCMSASAMHILQRHFPSSYSTCVYDERTSSYKITVSPDPDTNMLHSNKNTCMYVYGDGSFRFQGLPHVMPKICSSLKEALFDLSSSITWRNFTSLLIPINRPF